MSILAEESFEKTAFDELLVAELIPLVNVEFSYNLHTGLITTRLNNGSASVDQNRYKISTGAGANQSAQLFTKVPVKYYAGIGTLVRFTALFTTSVAGSVQIEGIGDSGDFLGFGYNGTAFGILRRKGGNPEIRSIQVTTKSTTAENITITLDGDADATVTVTDATAGDVTTTANDIAAHDYSNLGRGWKAIANGDTVNFISYSSEPRSGTYSLSGATTAVGTASQKLAGITPTAEDWIPQTAWSEDRFLFSTDAVASSSGITLDPTKGNVYQVVYGWLGFDAVAFFIKSPSTRKWVLVHVIEYANANLTPFINNPTLPLCAMVENTTNDTDIIMYGSSMGGFAQGKTPEPTIKHVQIIDKTFSSTTSVPVLTLHNNGVFQGRLNRVRMRVDHISAEVESGKPIVIQVVRGAVLTGASFSSHDAETSVALIDAAATALTNGEIIDAFSVSTADDKDKDVNEFIEPTEFLTISGAQATGGTNSVTKIIVNWAEDF